MTIIELLSTLLIGPLKLIFEIIYMVANRFINHPGLSIVVLSLIMNFLVLPLYKRADAMQEASRDIEAKLHDGVAHIKKTFTGDERMMILQTYYRQNNYKPTQALNGSVSLLLEVPFFMAAYQFLSNLQILEGVSLGPIADLSAPDAMLVIGAVSINLLPVIMTLVNVISSAIYLKGFPMKTKVQLYAMAAFFLVFLYKSPSGLVFYWTLNNLFSLVKTIFYKLKNPRKVLSILASVCGIAVLGAALFMYSGGSIKVKIAMVGMGLVMQYPILAPWFKKLIPAKGEKAAAQPNRKLFILGSVFLTVLVGLLIPSTFIAASPQEYIDVTYFHNPLWYVVSATCLAAGTFLVWMGVFYWLASPKGKVFFDRIVWVLCGVMLVNYMFFGTDLGIISSDLQYENGMDFSGREQLINLLVLLAVSVVLYLIAKKWNRMTGTVLLTAVIALSGMSIFNMCKMAEPISNAKRQAEALQAEKPHFSLSQSGKNVVVIMLDRALGEYVPYAFNEKPELAEQFDGFTYYANTISFGFCTNFGLPALVGGYEYTPVEMNKRDSEPLVSKHNAALKVMPVLFWENDYEVTVCDPTYANYQWNPDLSIYDEYPGIDSYVTSSLLEDTTEKQNTIQYVRRNFFCFSLMKTMPICLQTVIYDEGRYNQATSFDSVDSIGTMVQVAENMSMATGQDKQFVDSYNILKNMSTMTQITESDSNTFMFMTNDINHEPMILQEPDYVPALIVDNTEYDAENADRFTIDGRTLIVENESQMMSYQSFVATMIQLGNWFDYMRENGVYDNTRIILVADHGYPYYHLEELMIGEDPYWSTDVEDFFPLLMVKDFNSEGFTTSYEFMTNADVPTIAFQDLIENPTNPFTGKVINNDEKMAHEQYIILSTEWDVMTNNGNTFLPSMWGSVKDNLWDEKNWTFYYDEIVLKEHALP